MLQLPKYTSRSGSPNLETENSKRKLSLFRRILKPAVGILVFLLVGSAALGIINPASDKPSSLPAAGLDRTTSSTSNYPGYFPSSATATAAPAEVVAGAAASNGKGNVPAEGAAYSSAANPSGKSNFASQTSLPGDRTIIRNASLSIVAENVEKTLSDIRALAEEQNGAVMQASTTLRSDKLYANITIQVPAAAFDATITRLRKFAFKVESENTTTQDVTEEYVDTESQIRNLKATEASYVELLKKAATVSDVLTVQRELSNVRGEIERRQGRLNYLQKKSDNSSIILSLSPVLPENPKPAAAGWEASKIISQAWEGSLRGLQGLAAVLITIGVYSVWILPLCLTVFFVGRWSYRRMRQTPPPSAASTNSVVP